MTESARTNFPLAFSFAGGDTALLWEHAPRFTRAVCYQGFVDEALPDELKDANPLNTWRMIDGRMTKETLSADISLAHSSSRSYRVR